jgi:hypothetical protein
MNGAVLGIIDTTDRRPEYYYSPLWFYLGFI